MQLQDAYAVFFQRELARRPQHLGLLPLGRGICHDNDRRRSCWPTDTNSKTGRAESTERVYDHSARPLLQGRRAKISMASPEARSSTIVAKTSPSATPTSTPEGSRTNRADRLAKYS